MPKDSDTDNMTPARIRSSEKVITLLQSQPQHIVFKKVFQALCKTPSYNMLRHILNQLTDAELSGVEMDGLSFLATFENDLVKFYAEDMYFPLNYYEPGNSKQSTAEQLNYFISEGTQNPFILGLRAQIHFSDSEKKKGLALLRSAFDLAPYAHFLKLYYCHRLAPVKQNSPRVKALLQPLLTDVQDEPIQGYIATYLVLFYLATESFDLAADITNRYHSLMTQGDHAIIFAVMYWNPVSAHESFKNRITRFATEETARCLKHYPVDTLEEVLQHNTAALIAKLYEAWLQDPESALSLWDQVSSPDFSLNDFSSPLGEAALDGIARMFIEADEDRDFWLLIACFNQTPCSSLKNITREALTQIDQDHLSLPWLSRLWISYQVWHSDDPDAGQTIIPLMASYVSNAFPDYNGRENSDYIFGPLIPKKEGGNRPLPHFAKEICQSLKTVTYPESFYRGLWTTVVRSAVLDTKNQDNPFMRELVDLFCGFLSLDDPLFALSYLKSEDGDYQGAMAGFRRLLDAGLQWYSLYRNLSYCAEELGNLDIAYDYEKQAVENPHIQIPDHFKDQLERVKGRLEEQQSTINIVEGYSYLLTPSPEHESNIQTMSLTESLETLALIEAFSISGTDQMRPLLSQESNWLITESASRDRATDMLNQRAAFIPSELMFDGVSANGDKTASLDFYRIGISPNITPQGNWPVLSSALYQHIEDLLRNLTDEEVQNEVSTWLVDDLELYARERFEAYDIDTNFRAQFAETAEHCLKLFPLKEVYNLYKRVIEDSAARQAEYSMTNQHTVNYALKTVRNRASEAYNKQWSITPYERAWYASPPSAVIALILSMPDLQKRL